jgi:hypothetical protein
MVVFFSEYQTMDRSKNPVGLIIIIYSLDVRKIDWKCMNITVLTVMFNEINGDL